MTIAKTITRLMAGTAIIALSSFSAVAAVMPQIGAFNATNGERAGATGSGVLHLVQRRRGGGRGGRGRGRGRGRGVGRGRGRGRGGRGRRRRGSGFGAAIGAGIATAIIGGAIASSKRQYSGRWERCDDRFRSFRWSDGTYQPYGGGPRRLCPYLRN